MRRTRSLLERFIPKVEICPSGCWEWKAALRGKGGYAALNGPGGREGSQRNASHVAWFLAYGYWPKGMVLHTCDNPKCVKPSHLFLGDAQTNREDAIRKGRQVGLTKEDVQWAMGHRDTFTQAKIADRLRVTQSSISRLFSRKDNAHLP